MSSENFLVMVAGGIGSRINNSLPKQFIPIHAKPIIVHNLEKFIDFDSNINIIIACHVNYIQNLKTTLHDHLPHLTIKVVPGGETRFHSVKNALMHVSSSHGIVGIHDAARPLVSIETIRKCYDTANSLGNAIPFTDCLESIREVNINENKMVNRSNFKIIQTPQCFKINQLQMAYKQDYHESFTDDASVFETAGNKIHLIKGNSENIKITYPLDLIIAEHLLK